MLMKCGILLLVLTLAAQCLYFQPSNVVSLTTSNFDQVRTGVWVVEIYAPWCPHCRNFAPKYEKVATELKGIVKVAAINGDKEKVPKDIDFNGFPSVFLFVQGKRVEYTGDNVPKQLIQFVYSQYNKVCLDLVDYWKGTSSDCQQQEQVITYRLSVTLFLFPSRSRLI